MLNKKVCISISNLYYEYGLNLSDGMKIDMADDGYYDLMDSNRNYALVCMDGETCTVTEVNDKKVVLYNEDSKMSFELSTDEFKVATKNN